MKFSKISALIAAAVLAAASFAGCSDTKKPSDPSSRPSSSSEASSNSTSREIGKVKIDVNINDETELNNSTFKLNKVIDSGNIIIDNQKYIYLDVTIKNNMDELYKVNALNNFYLLTDDGTEIYMDIRADIFAKQYISSYEQLLEIPAGEEFNGYIGFTIPTNLTSFTVCYFATGTTNDKESVIRCPVTPQDIIPAPEGFINVQ